MCIVTWNLNSYGKTITRKPKQQVIMQRICDVTLMYMYNTHSRAESLLTHRTLCTCM